MVEGNPHEALLVERVKEDPDQLMRLFFERLDLRSLPPLRLDERKRILDCVGSKQAGGVHEQELACTGYLHDTGSMTRCIVSQHGDLAARGQAHQQALQEEQELLRADVLLEDLDGDEAFDGAGRDGGELGLLWHGLRLYTMSSSA